MNGETTQTAIRNPYWEEVQAFPGNKIEMEYHGRWQPDLTSVPYGEVRQARLAGKQVLSRDDLCIKYAWAIPDPESLRFVAQALSPRAVEIGAGTGYWASLLAQMGVDMRCYDLCPPQIKGENHWHSPRKADGNGLTGETREVFFAVREGLHQMAAEHADRTLFLCWPPYEDEMAYHTLQVYQGKRIVYVGEGDGGCTADEQFFALLDESWSLIDEHVGVQWWAIHDTISVYERK